MTATTDDPLGDGWERPRPDRRGYRGDAILALVMFVLSLGGLYLYSTAGFYTDEAPTWVSLLCVGVQSLPLALRRRWPAITLLIASAAFIATQLLMVPEVIFANISLFIAVYTLGAWGINRRIANVVRILVIIIMFAWLLTALVGQGATPEGQAMSSGTGTLSPFVAVGLISIVNNLLYFGGAYYFGNRAWASAREREALESRTVELAASRQREATQAVSLERLRIARDLHDVVAHHVSVMGVQAGAARRVLQRNPDQAISSLEAIEASARDAVDELHRMLGTLRDDGQPVDAAAGSPSTHGVDQLPGLIDDARAAGLEANLTIVGDPRPLTPTVSLTLFRVGQEAITNTIKHAGRAAALDVRLRYRESSIEIEVTDTGGSAAARPAGAGPRGAGLGLIGMRERVDAVGGTVETRPRARGGFLVRADIPTQLASPKAAS